MNKIGYIKGYCLIHDMQVSIAFEKNVMGGLFSCPYCGVLDSILKTDNHIFEPSKALLERLDK